MKIFNIKHQDGTFLARVTAQDSQTALMAVLKTAGVLPEDHPAISAEINYSDNIKLIIYLTENEKDTETLLSELTAEEKPTTEGRNFSGKLCIYCNNNPSTANEGDHVIARGFFAKANRNNTTVNILVPACQQCNSVEKSNHEEYMIGAIATSLAAAKHPDVVDLLGTNGPIRRSLERGRGPWPTILGNATPVFISDPSGIVTPTGLVSLNWSRFDFVLDKIAKGLFYHHYDKRLDGNYDTYAAPITLESLNKQYDFLKSKGGLGPFKLGDGVFTYACGATDSDPNICIWLMSFYEAFNIVVVSGPRKNIGDIIHLDRSPEGFPPIGYYVYVRDEGDKIIISPVNTQEDQDIYYVSGYEPLVRISALRLADIS